MGGKKRTNSSSPSGQRRPVDAQLLRQHVREMQQQGLTAYRLFEPVEQADLPAETKPAVRAQVARLVESLNNLRIRVGPEAEETAKTLLGLGPSEADDAFAAWAAAVATADIRRKASLLVSHFGGWLRLLRDERRRAIYPLWPQLAKGAYDLGEARMSQLLRSADSLASAEDALGLLRGVAAYGEGGPVFTGMCQVATAAYSLGLASLFHRLATAMPAPRVIQHRDGHRMVQQLSGLSDYCKEQGQAVWRWAFELIALLAPQSYPAVTIAARDLPDCLRGLPDDQVPVYLRDVGRLVEKMGVGASWFGLSKLPGLYAKYGADAAHALADAAASAAEAYGVTAGWSFLERKTKASRQLLEAK